MKDKLEASAIFKQFDKLIQNVFNHQSKSFALIMGVTICPMTLPNIFIAVVYPPPTKWYGERKNRHLLEVARSVMFASHVPGHVC